MTHLSFDETYNYLLTRIIQAVCYASALTRIPTKVFSKIDTLIDTLVMPWIGLNRHTPKAILNGTLEMGGLKYPQFEAI